MAQQDDSLRAPALAGQKATLRAAVSDALRCTEVNADLAAPRRGRSR